MTTKNNILYALSTLWILLFTACSQEEVKQSPSESNRIRISATLPQDAATRTALPFEDGHELRCILEVWSQDKTPALVYRSEQLGYGADGQELLVFETELESASYDCLIWADYVEANAPTEEISVNDKVKYIHYADKYYDTKDLKKIAVKDPSLLFYNNACDAFCGKTTFFKEAEFASNVTATLQRPFCKVVFMEKDEANFSIGKSMNITLKMPTEYNVSTEKPLNQTEVNHSREFAADEPDTNTERIVSTAYIFASAGEELALETISMNFVNRNNQQYTQQIPAGIPVVRNKRILARGYLMGKKIFGPEDAQIEVTVSDSWNTPDQNNEANGNVVKRPHVGDYLYKDGSYSKDYIADTDNPVIGVIFKVGMGKGDKTEDYGEIFRDKEIQGYALALFDTDGVAGGGVRLQSTDKKSILPLEEVSRLTVDEDGTGYTGYSNTQALLKSHSEEGSEGKGQYGALTQFTNNKYVLEAPEGSSGWYCPCAGQMRDLQHHYYNPETKTDGIVKKALQNLIDEGVEKVTLMNTLYNGSEWEYHTVSFLSTGHEWHVNFSDSKYGIVEDPTKDTAKGNPYIKRWMRPILTF